MTKTSEPGPKADPVAKEKEKVAKVKKWVGAAPTECDLCHVKIVDAFVDGVIQHGPWANMCPPCFATRGVGLGLGRGQSYKRIGDEWVKVEG